MRHKKEGKGCSDKDKKIILNKDRDLNDYSFCANNNLYFEYTNKLSLKPDFITKNKLRENIILKKYSHNLMINIASNEYYDNFKDIPIDYYKSIYDWIKQICLSNRKEEIDSSFWNIFNYMKSDGTILDSMIFGFIQAQMLYKNKGPFKAYKTFRYKSFNLLPCRILDYDKTHIKFDNFGVIETNPINFKIDNSTSILKISRNIKTELYFIEFGKSIIL
jgi:hypothetical protein